MQLVTVDDVLTMMGDTSNLGEEGELEKLIKAVGRVFSTNDGSDYIPYPTGYSGEVNKVGLVFLAMFFSLFYVYFPGFTYLASNRANRL